MSVSSQKGRITPTIHATTAEQSTPQLPTAAFLIGAAIKVRLKASKYDFTSHIPFFSTNEERSSSGSNR